MQLPAVPSGGGDEEEDILLAEPPAKRDDLKWKRPDGPQYKRGRYKRHQSTYNKGGRKKNYKNQATGEYGNTSRTVHLGYDPLKSLARGVAEGKTHNEIEEEKLFNTSRYVSYSGY